MKPNPYFIHLRKMLLTGDIAPATALGMVSDAFNRGELTRPEVLELLDMPPTGVKTTAPGGTA